MLAAAAVIISPGERRRHFSRSHTSSPCSKHPQCLGPHVRFCPPNRKQKDGHISGPRVTWCASANRAWSAWANQDIHAAPSAHAFLPAFGKRQRRLGATDSGLSAALRPLFWRHCGVRRTSNRAAGRPNREFRICEIDSAGGTPPRQPSPCVAPAVGAGGLKDRPGPLARPALRLQRPAGLWSNALAFALFLELAPRWHACDLGLRGLSFSAARDATAERVIASAPPTLFGCRCVRHRLLSNREARSSYNGLVGVSGRFSRS